MAEFQGDCIAKSKGSRCWRLCHVQTSGCMAAERRTDHEQKEQQQIMLDYVADRGCGVVGLGDTLLGDDASEVSRMARGVMGRVNDEALTVKLRGLDAQRRAKASMRMFWKQEGEFSDELAMVDARDLDTDDWWIEYGDAPEHAEILYMAKRILPQPTAMTSAERDWKTYDYVHSKSRVRLTAQCASDLVYVNSHLQLQESIHWMVKKLKLD